MHIIKIIFINISLVTSSFTSSIIFALGCIFASRQLHGVLLENVMRWPMELFDQTPVGRILNRFSKEIDILDIVLPENLRSFMLQFFGVNFNFLKKSQHRGLKRNFFIY